MSEAARYAMRLTMCKCGHVAIAHYDSWDFCTHKLDGTCDCEEFDAAGPEILVQISPAPLGVAEETK